MDGAKAWFTWFFVAEKIYKDIFLLIGGLVCILHCRLNFIKLVLNKNIIVGLSALYIELIWLSGFSFASLLYNIAYIFPLWVLLSDTQNIDYLLQKIICFVAFILIIGLVMHIYMLVKGSLPGVPIVFPTNANYIFMNYGFILKGIGSYESEGIRFQSIFLEPGYCATLISFLLFTIKYDFKRYKLAWILLIGLCFTLSLAGYILLTIGLILIQWSKYRSIRIYCGLFFLFLLVYFSVQQFNEGKNTINEAIFDRLAFDSEKGIAGNNRTGAGADFYFERVLKNNDYILGIGYEEINRINGGNNWENVIDYSNQIRGAGYKIFIITHGVVALFLVLIVYYNLGVIQLNKKRYAWAYFIIIIITFIQAAYPQSYSWLIPFIMGCSPKNNITANI